MRGAPEGTSPLGLMTQVRKKRNRMTRRDWIAAKLTEGLSPAALTVTDESHLHAGHAGARPEGETHFRVDVVAAAFEGKGRVEGMD